MLKKYCFIADVNKEDWENVQDILANLPADIYCNQPSNKPINILCDTFDGIPAGTLSLLGLSLKFSIKKPFPTNDIDKSLERIQKDIRTKYFMKDKKDPDKEFIRKLYIKSFFWNPSDASDKIKKAFDRFGDKIRAKQGEFIRYSRPNLTPQQNSACAS